jgi:hypothetical protein
MKQASTILAALALLGAPSLLRAQPAEDLETMAEQAAAALRDKLPIQADEVTTAVDVRADGTEFVYDMRLNEVLTAAQLEERQRLIQRRNQINMCNGEAGDFIRRGGSMRHVYTDAEGNQFETRVARCPPAE